MASAYSSIAPTAAGHFRLNFLAAVCHLIHMLHRLGAETDLLANTLRQHPFLSHYLEQIVPYMPDGLSWDDLPRWWRTEITTWESTATESLPLVALVTDARLGYVDRMALMIVALGEEDSRFGTLFESLQSPLTSRRPSLELIGQIMNATDTDGRTVCSDLLPLGLIEVVNPDAPRSEWTLKLTAAAWRMIRGEFDGDLLPGCRLMPADSFPPLGDLILDDDLLARLSRLPALIEDGKIRTVVVRGMPGSNQLQVLGSLAGSLGRGLAVIAGAADRRGEEARRISPPLLGPLCVMGRVLPVFDYDLAPGETAEAPALPGYRGPIGIILGQEGGVGGATTEASLTLSLPLLSAEQRMRCWRDVLGDRTGADLVRLSERFLLPGEHVRQAAAMALGRATLDGRDHVDISDVREACRALNRQMLDTHAALLEGGGSRNELIVSEPTMVRLSDLALRCRHRERLLQHLGSAFSGNANRGVRALFTGASGTGKTLAAKIIAAELGMDLYRVDLGAVVNKYIGETEKNLHQVLSRAEALDVILLLDEGDSLLGNRTEIKSANDRYANLETNYLLQRLESYQGIVIVTTNAAQSIDRAFQRRMDVVVPFVHPQADERRAIWRLHLPERHLIGDPYFEQVVQRCALTGGQIRNAALHATLLAVDEGRGLMRECHLEASIRGEYRKAGATCPLDGGVTVSRRRGVSAFMEVMRS